jgi:hypothetical protein
MVGGIRQANQGVFSIMEADQMERQSSSPVDISAAKAA